MLLPFGSPLPDDAVSAVRGQSGMLAGLSVPLGWGMAIRLEDDEHRAPEPEVCSDAVDKAADALDAAAVADGINQRSESRRWDAEAEPRFDVARTSSVVPHSPAAG
ncbi:hypothetical protein [Mycobacterium sp.]|uniref:hypothetical protein n=1 Tax=Mycobacterium sp. TaxID=1785 RepID=UPI003C713E9D